MQNAELDESQAGIKIDRRNIHNLREADDTTLMAESEEELNSLLMWVKEKSERAGLRLNIKKKKRTHKDHGIRPHYYMANRRGKGESSDRFLLGRKAMTNLDSVFVEKQRRYLADKGLYSQGYGLPSGHIQL